MLKGYSATIKGNHIHWLDAPPIISEDQEVIIMVLPTNNNHQTKGDCTIKRQPPEALKGLGRETGDIVNIAEYETLWEYHDDFDYS